ncbi:MAG: hypothetical protein IJS61_01630 [Firmicutes bacterium]|nr:hypothetical protein [Bacillota bacterium]
MKKSTRTFFERIIATAVVTSALFTSVYAAEPIWGDVNGTGTVDADDAATTLQYVLHPESTQGVDTSVMDVNVDDTYTSADAAHILQKANNGQYLMPVEVPAPDAVDVFVVGDSTACHYAETEDAKYWFKRVGFGDALSEYFVDEANVVNLALSGRSSKSFATGINENGIEDTAAKENYSRLVSEIGEGDFLIIAWGHNDEKTDRYRFTDPNGDINTEGSFKNSLYTKYIKVAQDAGATPILCTPIIRRNAGSALSNNDVHIPAAGDYAQCIRDLATELNIDLIDNLNTTRDLWTSLGAGTQPGGTYADPTGYAQLHAATQDGSTDNTHLNSYGASVVAYNMAKDILALNNGLTPYVKSNISAPVFDLSKVKNPDWEAFDESIYIPSSIWKVSSPWAGSVFGSSVGVFTEDSHDNFDIAENGSSASVRLLSKNNKGKIASSEDGIVMYFQEIPKGQNFTITTTAHINEYDASVNQTAFGVMVRDNMFSDYQYKTNAPYVAVGNTSQNSGANMVSVWSRPLAANGDKNLTQNNIRITDGTNTANEYPAGTEVELKLTRKDGVVTATYGSEAPVVVEGIDFDSVTADTDYVGVFVSRTCDVTFNNTTLTLE